MSEPIKKWKQFINENDKLDDIISQLDNMGIVYELSKNEFKGIAYMVDSVNEVPDLFSKINNH